MGDAGVHGVYGAADARCGTLGAEGAVADVGEKLGTGTDGERQSQGDAWLGVSGHAGPGGDGVGEGDEGAHVDGAMDAEDAIVHGHFAGGVAGGDGEDAHLEMAHHGVGEVAIHPGGGFFGCGVGGPGGR